MRNENVLDTTIKEILSKPAASDIHAENNLLATAVYGKLEEALTLIQRIKAIPDSPAHRNLLTASNDVWDAQLMMTKFMKGGES